MDPCGLGNYPNLSDFCFVSDVSSARNLAMMVTMVIMNQGKKVNVFSASDDAADSFVL